MLEEIFLRRARMLLPWDECILFTQPYGGDDMSIDNGMIGTMHYAHHDLLNDEVALLLRQAHTSYREGVSTVLH